MRLIQNRELLPQIGIIVCFILMGGWFRLHVPLGFLPLYYNTRFVLFLAMGITVALWLVGGAPGLRTLAQRPLRALWLLPLLFLAIWAFASQSWAYVKLEHPEVAANAALAWGILALFVVVTAAVRPPRLWVFVAVVGVALLNGLLTILQVAEQGSLGLRVIGEFPFSAEQAGVSLLRAGEITFVRPYGLYPHPNILGGLLTVGGLLTGSAAVTLRGRMRWAALAVCSLLVWALLITFSRSAWLGLAGGAVVLLLRIRFRLPALVPAAAAAVVIGAAFFVTYQPLLAARTGEGTESLELRSIADRVVFTDFARRAIEERPLLGQGVGNFPWRASAYIAETFFDLRGDQVHNIYLAVWAEMGAVGILLFLTALGLGLIAVLRRRRSAPAEKPAPNWIGPSFFAAFVALAIIGLFDHYPYSQLPLMALWWGFLACALHDHEPPVNA